MAIELIVVEGMFLLLVACLFFAWFSGLKIFWVSGFVLLMLVGLVSFASGGVITGHYYDTEGVFSDTVLVADSGLGFVFSSLCLWGGLILSVWSVLFSTMLQASGSGRKVFVWD